MCVMVVGRWKSCAEVLRRVENVIKVFLFVFTYACLFLPVMLFVCASTTPPRYFDDVSTIKMILYQ